MYSYRVQSTCSQACGLNTQHVHKSAVCYNLSPTYFSYDCGCITGVNTDKPFYTASKYYFNVWQAFQ